MNMGNENAMGVKIRGFRVLSKQNDDIKNLARGPEWLDWPSWVS